MCGAHVRRKTGCTKRRWKTKRAACTARAFGYRRLLVALPIGLVACLVIFWLFDRVLALNLPTGALETAIFGA